MPYSETISVFLQFVCLLTYECGIACSLWQVGNSTLTLLCMASAPILLGLSRINWRFFPEELRILLQLAIAGSGLYWFAIRSGQEPVDVAVMECAAVFCTALFLRTRPGEHLVMAILSLCMGLYGGLHPGREMYFPVFILLLLILAFLMYVSRAQSLGVSYNAKSRQNWYVCSVHFTLSILLACIGMRTFVIHGMRTRGIMPVSFQTGQEHEFPQLCGRWLAPTKQLLEGDDGNSMDSKGSKALVSPLSKSRLFVQGDDDFSSRNGAGEGQGEKLLFRAYTTAKLYWTVQVYDTYDGNDWSRSPALKSGKNALDEYTPEDCVLVTQNIAIMQNLTTRLPYAYRPISIGFGNDAQPGVSHAIIKRYDALSFGYLGASTADSMLVYTVKSMVPLLDLKERPKAWGEPPRNFGWNCRTIPPCVRTPQLMELAFSITQNANTPMEKADALRDYLRKNYKYNAEAPSIPEDQETVNYFLFKSKEGSCRHFSQALVILARMNGLHARLATGYSPGNFNMLTNSFDIYQYHSHAWAQIFIEPYGWLTYDGVAPGNLRIGDNNRHLLNLFDPFGDTWKSKSPELSPDNTGESPQQMAQAGGKDALGTNEAIHPELQMDVLEKIEKKAQKDARGKTPDGISFVKATASVALEYLLDYWKKAEQYMALFWQKVLTWLKLRGIRFLCYKKQTYFVMLGCAISLTLLLWWCYHGMINAITQKIRYLKCAWLWHKACHNLQKSPALCIVFCQQHNDVLLKIKCRRIPMGDAVERAAAIHDINIRLLYESVAETAHCVWYSAHIIDANLAKNALENTKRLRNSKW